MRDIQSLWALNRGVVDRRGLARADVKRIAMAAQVQTNWMPRVLGSMGLRVGWGYLNNILNNLACKVLKFVFATTDTALLELTPLVMQILINDAVLTRPGVTSTITNGTFAVDLTGWTQMDDAGATSSWVAPNFMQLVGDGNDFAIREQAVSVTGANISTEHGIRIVIARGPVMLRIGSTSGADDYLTETTLYEGTHSISVIPTGTFYIRFFSRLAQLTWVSQCTIEAAGPVQVPTPWGASDLQNIRYTQSADVIFVACQLFQQRRIERRGARPNGRSWSVVKYIPIDGPFSLPNTSPTTLATSALSGNVTVTASAALFEPKHVGALFSITSVGQIVTATGSANGVFTASIRVTGVSTSRAFSVVVSGNNTSSVVDLQRSYDNLTWANVGDPYEYTTNVTTGVNDTLDNQIVYYRLFLTTRNSPDTVAMTLNIGSGSVRGVVRVTDYTSSTSVNGEVVVNLGGVAATSVWEQGQWSDLNGWPTAVNFHEGRLWWAGQNGIWGSVSDAFDSFDETFVGDAGPINRTIGSGPLDAINWIASLAGMCIGGQGAEYLVRASSLDEPLTPADFNVKCSSTQGSGNVDHVKIDQGAYFINRSTCKLFELAFDIRSYNYVSSDQNALAPEILLPGVVRMDVQRTPDTRIHCVRSDGTVVIAVIDKVEDVLAWIPVDTTAGFVEDVVVLPAAVGNLDDQVYYVVRRVINGFTVRHLEKWAQEVDCRGDKQLCFLADSYLVVKNTTFTNVLTGLGIFEGQPVVVWADGEDVGTDDSTRPWTLLYTVMNGQITLAKPCQQAVVGLPYIAQFQSAKLGAIQQGASPLNQQKTGNHIGIVATDIHPKGIKFGPTLDDTGSMQMDDMPEVEQGGPIDQSVMRADYDENLIEFPGTWTTDLRVCIQAQAPRPATILGITMDEELNS